MKKIGIRRFQATPGEKVSVNITTTGNGSVFLSLDGVNQGIQTKFDFTAGPAGTQHALVATLTGPNGSGATVGISTVDGGTESSKMVIVAPILTDELGWDFPVVAPPAVPAGGGN